MSRSVFQIMIELIFATKKMDCTPSIVLGKTIVAYENCVVCHSL